MTSFSKNPIMITGTSSISPKAGDNREIFPCPVDQPQTHGCSQTQVSPGAHSSEPIVIDDEDDGDDDDDDDDYDYDFLQEGHHSPESRGIDFLVNSPKNMAENLRGPCRRIPHNGRPGLRWSSLGFGQDLRNHRHQPAQSSGNSPISNSIGTVQPPQQPDGQSAERNIDTIPSLRTGAGTHPGRNSSRKDTTTKGTPLDPAQNLTFTPDGLTLETSARGRAFSRGSVPSTGPCEETVLSIPHERMETTAPFDGLDNTTIAESAKSHANLPDAQQISDTHIPGVGRSETSDTSQRTVLGSLPLDYPLDESFTVDAFAPASTQPPDLHNNATEPINSWSTGENPWSLHRQKRQVAKPTSFRPSKLSRSLSVHAAEEPSDDHITSDSGFEAGYRSRKRQRKTLGTNRRRSLQREAESKSLGSSSAAACAHPTQPLPLSFDSPRSQVYPLPDTRIICTELSGKTFFQVEFTWDGCHHTEDDWNEGGSQGTQRVSGPQEQRSRKGTQKSTSIDDESDVYDADCILTCWKKRSYLVLWSDGSCTWEPKSHLGEGLISDFEREFDGFRKGVEIIATRVVKGPKSKNERVLYHLKWQGRPEKEKCWVEEDTLSPSLLEEYWKTQDASTPRRG